MVFRFIYEPITNTAGKAKNAALLAASAAAMYVGGISMAEGFLENAVYSKIEETRDTGEAMNPLGRGGARFLSGFGILPPEVNLPVMAYTNFTEQEVDKKLLESSAEIFGGALLAGKGSLNIICFPWMSGGSRRKRKK